MGQDVQRVLEEAFAEDQNVLIKDEAASYIPGPAKADSSNLGCYIINVDGNMYKVGDYSIPFTMQSIAKAPSLILALQTSDYDHTFSRVDMEPTDDRFDNIFQLELKNWRPFNPMIDTGAIVTADCIVVADPFGEFLTLIRKLCGNPEIQSNEKVHHSKGRTGTRNRSTAYLLKSDHALDGEPKGVLDVYSRTCPVTCTARNLAHCAMTLSNKGVDPETGEHLLDAGTVCTVMALMMFCGMYDGSGEYAVKVGLSSKSGVGGGIIAVEQNGIDIGTFGPTLNRKGNSVGGERILQYLSERLGYHIFT